MIKQSIKTIFIAMSIGWLTDFFNQYLQVTYLQGFLKQNLITILVALLAINTATLSIVLTKIRDLLDTLDVERNFFQNTQKQMLFSIKEQIGLIVFSIFVLSTKESPKINGLFVGLLDVMTIAIFSYALIILYDTAKSVFIIIDFQSES